MKVTAKNEEIRSILSNLEKKLENINNPQRHVPYNYSPHYYTNNYQPQEKEENLSKYNDLIFDSN